MKSFARSSPAFQAGTAAVVEAPAGLLDNADPETRIKAETEEETGFRVREVRQIFDAFISPGSVTERLHFFVGEYELDDQAGQGGGNEDEGEDIAVLETSIEDALDMVSRGTIRDAKAIMLLQYAALNIFAPASVSPEVDPC